MTKGKKIALISGAIALLAILGIGLSSLIWYQRNVPELHGDPAAHFKYGSIGSEGRSGIPYWVWTVLPEVFPEHLPDGPGEGLQQVRLHFRARGSPKGRPIGTTYREDPVPMVGLNCALCHTGVFRESPEGPERVVLGMPAHQFDLGKYLDFLFAVANDDRFDADSIIPAIKRANPDFSWIDGLLYRHMVIPQTREGLLREAGLFSWMDRFPSPGPGRVDTFNPYKFNIFQPGRGKPARGHRRSAVAVESGPTGRHVAALGREQRLGGGAEQKRRHRRRRVGRVSRPARHAARGGLDQHPASARFSQLTGSMRRKPGKGRRVFAQHCAVCHAFDGAQVGQVVAIEDYRYRPGTPELVHLRTSRPG